MIPKVTGAIEHPIIATLFAIPVVVLVTVGYCLGHIIGPFISGFICGWNEARYFWNLNDLDNLERSNH